MPLGDGADVTVVIPAYRAAGTIAKALDSVVRQTLAPARVIVVMDGHDGDTAARIDECRPRLGEVELTVLCQDHQGAGAARNQAIAEVRTNLVAFLDADDEWMPDKLARTIPTLAEPTIVLTCHDMIVVDRDSEHRSECRDGPRPTCISLPAFTVETNVRAASGQVPKRARFALDPCRYYG